MNIQLLSDLHFEFFDRETDHLGKVQIHPEADVVVLAGDIDNGEFALKRANGIAMEFGKPVIFVPGNHEFYGQELKSTLKKYRAGAYGVHVLLGVNYPNLKEEEKSVVIDGVRFCGGTLWTDFKLYKGSVRIPNQTQAIAIGQSGLNDFRRIKINERYFTAEDSVNYNKDCYDIIKSVLDTPFTGKTVLITHHGIHSGSIHPNYAAGFRELGSPTRLPNEDTNWTINPAFCSHFPELVEKVDLCLHGHTHETLDYKVGKTRVVTNPRGYPLNRYGEINWENSSYEPQKLVTI